MRAAVLVLLVGCGEVQPPSNDIACIHTIDAARYLKDDSAPMILASAGCTGDTRLDILMLQARDLRNVVSFPAAAPGRYVRTRLGDIDGTAPSDIVAVVEGAPAFDAYTTPRLVSVGQRVELPHPVEDIALADVDLDGMKDVIVVGDNAVRVRLGAPGPLPAHVTPAEEITLVSGKPFVTALALEGTFVVGAQLVYVARGDGVVEVGDATRTAQSPPAFQLGTATMTVPGAPRTPLVTADLDNDGLPDVAGATTEHVFVRTGTGAVVQLPESAADLAIGDIDGDGMGDLVFLTADRTALRRARLAAGVLVAEPLLDVAADAITIGDLDGDGFAEIALLEHADQPDSSISLYSLRNETAAMR